jgi:hypothetical protein
VTGWPRRRNNRVPAARFAREPEHPAPTYPQYEQLLADAAAAAKADHMSVDPGKLRRVQNLGRSWDWKTAVLGHANGSRTLLEMHMLLLADEWDLKPPPPQWLVERRAAEAAADQQKQARREARDNVDQAAWDAVRAHCPVDVQVRRNSTARARYGFLHNLGHAIPTVDAESGPTARPRRHPAGRAVCETVTRAKPLDLSGGEGGPATCERCLKITPGLRPARSTGDEP